MTSNIGIWQSNPVKLFIQDIYRSSEDEVKYIYRFCGMRFKNIHIHGVVIENHHFDGVHEFVLSDPTASVRVRHNRAKSNSALSPAYAQELSDEFERKVSENSPLFDAMNLLRNRIVSRSNAENPHFDVGDCVSVVGDIFIDSITCCRNVSAFECYKTSNDRDVLWMNELSHIYRKYYYINEFSKTL